MSEPQANNEFEVDMIRTARRIVGLGDGQFFDEKPRAFELWYEKGDLLYRLKRWDKNRVLAVHYKKNNYDTWSIQ
jgi:hypothetical protein